MRTVLLLALSALLFVSCESEVGSMETASPDGTISIALSATKIIAEPMVVTMNINVDGKDFERQLQVYNSEISEETVLINWPSETECRMIFLEQDGAKKGLYVRRRLDGVEIASFDPKM